MSGQPPRGRGRGRGGDAGRGQDSQRGSSRGRGDSFGRGQDSQRGSSRGGPGDGRGRGRGGDRGGREGGPPQQNIPIVGGRPQTMPDPAPGIFRDGNIPAPDPDITKKEDQLVSAPRSALEGPSGLKYPRRPGFGTSGNKIILRANYFHLQANSELGKQDVVLYRYRVDVKEPRGEDEPSKGKTRRVLELMLEDTKFAGMTKATDYSHIIITNKKVDLGTSNQWTGTLIAHNKDEAPFAPPQESDPQSLQQARARKSYRFRVTADGTFTLDGLVQYLSSTSAGAYYASRDDTIQLLNILIARIPNFAANVFGIGQNKFYPTYPHPLAELRVLGNGLQAQRGYYSSVRPAVGRILVNLNVASAAFYQPIPLVDLMNQYIGGDRIPRHPGDLERCEAFLRMVRVWTKYLKPRNAQGEIIPGDTVRKTKTVVGFAGDPDTRKKPDPHAPRFGNAKQVSFEFTDGNNKRRTTVFDYFRNHHSITLQRWQEPVINVGTRGDPMYLAVELCTIEAGQPARRLLAGNQTSEMIRFAARAPNANAVSIEGTANAPGNALTIFGFSPNDQPNTTQPVGYQINPQMITVPGRILSSPQLQYGGQKENPRMGSWNLAGKRFNKAGAFNRWSCLIINHAGQRGLALQAEPGPLIDSFGQALKSYGINIPNRVPNKAIQIPGVHGQDRGQTDKLLQESFQGAEKFQIDVVFVVLREADKWLYSRIKFWGDVKFGIQTICSVGSKLQKPAGQQMYFANVALKFNIKGNGTAHSIPPAELKPLDNRTMLMGIDVTHPSPGSAENAPSIAAVVANYSVDLCQFPGSIMSQRGTVEMVQDLKKMILERLDCWQRKNKNMLPDKIIVYRDGVSEGQYDLVLQNELPAFHEAFKERYGAENKWPKVAIIIVGKRHHTRFYPTRREDADDRHGFNPRPGTVVDRGVTNPLWWEFYLQAHQGLQGTARPAHYVVIKDDIGFGGDQIQTFTHKMCYLFNRATKAVSICPPAYYADLLCERGRSYLYSTLAENRGANTKAYTQASAEWVEGVHQRLRDRTFYI